MRLLLDEDSSGALLARLLRNAGHDVESAVELGTTGDPDPKQLIYAIRQGRLLMTRNADDFKLLHELVLTAGGHHSGIIITHYENNAARDFTPRGIVTALGKLAASGPAFRDSVHILNQWR
jgi:predicted nuclease of predicted toxin-antitoxin system